MSEAVRRSLRALFTCVAFVAIALIAYARVLPTGFLSDDFELIEPLVARRPYAGWAGFFRPLTVLSLMLDVRLYRAWAPGFHATSVVLHGLNGALLMLALTKAFEGMRLPRARAVAIVSAVSFVAMPSHTEAVSWIAGRGDVLATLFGLSALCFFLVSISSQRMRDRIASLVFLGFALLAKEAAIVWAPTFCVLAIARSRALREPLSSFTKRTLAGAVVVVVLYIGIRAVALGTLLGGYGAKAHGVALDGHLVLSIVKYAVRTFVPATSIFDGLTRGAKIALAIIPTSCAVLAMTIGKRDAESVGPSAKIALSLVVCFLIAIAPTIGIGLNYKNTEGERFLYLPSAFAAALPFLFVLARPSAWRASAMCIVLIASQLFALDRVNLRWEKASSIAERILSAVERRDPRTMLVLDLPDNHQGAYVFRMGFRAALAMRGGPSTQEPRVLAQHDTNHPDVPYNIEVTPSEIRLTLEEHDVIRMLDPEGHLVSANDQQIMLALDAIPPQIERVLVFEGGDGPIFRDVRVRVGR